MSLDSVSPRARAPVAISSGAWTVNEQEIKKQD
jgi:hypothetical protein